MTKQSLSKIRKRDGRIVSFRSEKITEAITKALAATGTVPGGGQAGQNYLEQKRLAQELSSQVTSILKEKFIPPNIPSVEETQDIVEEILIRSGFAKTAKAYILYRETHKKIRETKSTFVDVKKSMDEYLEQSDWRVRENSNTDYSFSGLMLHTAGKVIANYVLNEIYTPQIAEAHRQGYFHIHDLGHGVVGYCSGWSLRNLLAQGFGNVPNKVDAKPAKHLSVVVHQMVNYIGCLQMEFAGAQAFSVHPKETVVIKDKKGKIKVARIGEFCNSFLENDLLISQNGLEYADISDQEYKALSFNKEGKAVWKRITKAIRHKTTDPLYLVRTNKGSLRVSKSHSVFSVDGHQYLGRKEKALLGDISQKKELFSYDLEKVAQRLNIDAPEKVVQKLVSKGLVKNRLENYEDSPERHYAVYTPTENHKKLVLKRTSDLDNLAREIKAKDNGLSNLAALSQIDLPQENSLDLYEVIKESSIKEKIYVTLSSLQAEKLKQKIQKETSLRQFSYQLGRSYGFLWTMLKRRKVRFDIYERFSDPQEQDIKFVSHRSKIAAERVFKRKKLELLVKLLAWYLAEGWPVSNHSMGLVQNKQGIGEIIEIAQKLKISYFLQNYDKKTVIVLNGVLPAIISSLCGKYSDNKEVPSFLYSLSQSLREIFLEEFAKGDGYLREENLVLVSTSNKLITGLNLMALSLGYRTSIKTRHQENFAHSKEGYSNTTEGGRLTRYDLIIHNRKDPEVIPCGQFESAVVFENEEDFNQPEYEYDLSVEDTESFVGGVGLFGLHNSSVDTLLAPFVRADGLDYKEVKQNMQQLVFSLNIPSRWGCQMPFTNLTFDWTPPPDLKNEPAVVGGKPLDNTYGDYQEEMNLINRAFLEVMREGDANGRIFTFPIPTYNLMENFDWESENAKLLFEVAAKYGTPYFQNYIGSGLDPRSVRAMCCRLNLDTNELMKRPGGMWGPGESTGSIGVVTINVNRLGYEAKETQEFLRVVGYYMLIAKDSLEIKRRVIEKNIENGFMPYTKSYLGTFRNYFSTIGLCGMNEASLNLLGKDISTPEGKDLTMRTLNYMRERLKEFQQETGNLYNLEATPAESTAYRLAKLDKEMYSDIITAGQKEPYLTNSTHLPVDYTDDAISAVEHQKDIQPLYTGGTIFHLFLGERMSGGEACKTLVKKIAENTAIPYFTITPTFSICRSHGYLKGEQEKCPSCGEETEVYSRIVGYFRPTKNWNLGKKEEFKERLEYAEQKSLKSQFQEISPLRPVSADETVYAEKLAASEVSPPPNP